jgi:membrane-bound metal-dependent hydrolase YbcI (DUF457 family)
MMIGKSHLTTGVTAAVWTAYALPLPDHIAVMTALVGSFAALAPDIDHMHSRASHSTPDARYVSWLVRLFVTHRGPTHDLRYAPAAFGGLAAFGSSFLPPPLGGYWWAWGVAVAVGVCTHIWGDSRTHSGVPWGGHRLRCGRLFHLGVDRRMNTFHTGSDRELFLLRVVYRPVAVSSVVAAGWLVLT